MIRSFGHSRDSSYEPIDAADFDDQNDDVHNRGPRPRPTAYRRLHHDPEEEDDFDIIHNKNNRNDDHASQYSLPSWTAGDERQLSHFQSPPVSAGTGRSGGFAQPWPRDPKDHSIRSVSREGSVLSHPTPDLQSIQGAYTHNVSRLEESAERLSLNSDIGEELRKLNMEQKRADSRRSSVKASRQFSHSSQTNSIIAFNNVARSGGFTRDGYVASPISSLRSPTWSQEQTNQPDQIAHREPLQEGKPLDSPVSVRSNILTVRNQDKEQSPQDVTEERGKYTKQIEKRSSSHYSNGVEEKQLQRTASAATKSTYHQAEEAFADFDGVHISHSPTEEQEELYPRQGREQTQQPASRSFAEFEALDRDMSLSPVDRAMNFSPTLAESLQSYTRNPEPGETGMVFYPAPVPMMLNLPQKLSKNAPAAKMAQRRSQFMLPKRKSTQNLAGVLEEEEPREQEQKLPPQLRATMYFDMPSVPQAIELKEGSAVATLDSILDASIHVPVSAFTDHPIVGQAGAEGVYSREKSSERKPLQRRTQSTTDVFQLDEQEEKRKSFLGFGRKNKAQSTQLTNVNLTQEPDEDEPLRKSLEEDRMGERIDEHQAQIDEDIRRDRPTTLLAELQMRKVEQSRRNRTAATAYPDGMRSTLLQLDAVTQHQISSRKQKQVQLAWEDPTTADEPERDETEDVPLGMLFPTNKLAPKSSPFEEDRPLGLLAQRQMEESEPLSARRARLRGEPKPQPGTGRRSAILGTPSPEPRPLTAEEKEEEEETLAQRKRRLAIKDAIPTARPVSGDFSSELLSVMGVEEKKPPPPAQPSVTPDPEETLGQRRKRLQAERETAQRQVSSNNAVSNEAAALPTKRNSMADLLTAHPASDQTGGRDSVQARGLLALAEGQRHSNLNPSPYVRNTSGGSYNSYGGLLSMPMGSAQQVQQKPQRTPSLAPGYYKPMSQQRLSKMMQQQQQRQQQGQLESGHQLQSILQIGAGQGQYVNPMTYAPMMGMNGRESPVPAYTKAGLDHIPLNPKQRDMIDRWRQSIVN